MALDIFNSSNDLSGNIILYRLDTVVNRKQEKGSPTQIGLITLLPYYYRK